MAVRRSSSLQLLRVVSGQVPEELDAKTERIIGRVAREHGDEPQK